MKRFAEVCDAVAATTKKKEKVRLVGEYLKSLAVEDAARAAVFLSGKPFANREERVLAIGGSALTKIVAALAGKALDQMGYVYREHGDLGDVAEQLLRDRGNPATASLQDLAAAFEEIAATRKPSAKADILRGVFEKAGAGGVKYGIKIVTGDLRIGLKESLVEEAIALAYGRPVDDVRRANMITGDIAETLRLAFRDALASPPVRIFYPLGFMLATPAENAREILPEGRGEMFVEEKYDGIRAQVHKNALGVKMFSRTLDEITEFPELAAPISALPGELILDGEILAWDGARPMPFTDLQKRLVRKQAQKDLWSPQDIPVVFVAFDLLYQDGTLLLDTPMAERRKRFESLGQTNPGAVRIASARRCDSAAGVELAFRDSLQNGHEGIVAKSPDSPYVPGRRGGWWFKLKEPFATLDVVVTAVEYGHGKRHRVLSDYTFAVRHGQQLLNIGKAYSGLTDAEILQYTEFFLEHTLEDQGYRRTVEPTVVIEVTFNNIQRSTRHESGYALRFPRILRFRPEKPVAEIDTLERVGELYASQTTLPRAASKPPAGEDASGIGNRSAGKASR